MKYLVIGDIHGCYDELMELIEISGISADDHIIALGDIVDRGPDSPKVVEFFRTASNASAILGNHERKHIRSHKGITSPATSQYLARLQFVDNQYIEAIKYFETLPLYIDLPEATLIHGALEPGVELSMQDVKVITGNIGGEKYLNKKYSKPWYELYDGEKPVIAGHINYNGNDTPMIYKDRIFFIDTSCCQGYSLTGIILPDFRICSVKSSKCYCTDSMPEV